MDIPSSDVKDWVSIAKPFIDPLISTIIKPKLDKLSKFLKKQEQNHTLIDNVFENKFEEFIARTYSRCVSMNILIFQNQQIKIHEIYHPLTICCAKDNSWFKVKTGNLDLFSKYKRVLISDSAGMGKSTLMKWIACQLIEGNKSIPILIELRNLTEDHDVLDEIYDQINQLDEAFDQDLILKLLGLGNFTILFDGLDEIQPKSQEIVIKEMLGFIGKAQNNEYILTSRPESALAAFGDFQLFRINDLALRESFDLIRKYDSISPTKVAASLIRDIEINFQQTSELLVNPFLVSLIYCTYTYNKDIPSKKVIFYDEIYSALFKRHDLSKYGWTRQKKSKLDIHRFKLVLRQFAFDTAIKGMVAYSESEFLDFIENAKIRCGGMDFLASDLLDDLLSAVPLFVRDGSKIRWAHKSLQDFFAADFIAFDSKKEIILSKIYESGKEGFLNILELFNELDYKTFRNSIIKPLIEEYIAYYNSTYQKISGVPDEQIDERKSLLFDRKMVLLREIGETYEKSYEDFQEPFRGNLRNILGGEYAGRHMGGYSVYYSGSFKRELLKVMAKINYVYVSYYGRVKERLFPKINEVKIKKGEFIIIDDTPESKHNESRHFNNVTKFILDYVVHPSEFRIDYKKMVEEIEIINQEMLNEKRLNNFLDI